MASNSNNSGTSGGASIAGLLGIAFVVLKLTHVIGWSWWWVTAPFWGGLALAAVLAVIALAILAILAVVGTRRRAR